MANPFRPYRFNHDYYFLAKAVIEGVLGTVPEQLVNYRVHANNTITTAPAPLIREMLRMHLDLFADLATDLKRDSEMRHRFYQFMRSSWDSVSSFHAGLFQLLLAELAHEAGEAAIERVVGSLDDEAGFPELAVFPNKALVNSHDGSQPLSVNSGLAERFEKLRTEKSELKEKGEALRSLAKRRAELLQSRWLALGRFVGAARQVNSDRGKTPAEKLEHLNEAIASSRWIRIGDALGFTKLRRP